MRPSTAYMGRQEATIFFRCFVIAIASTSRIFQMRLIRALPACTRSNSTLARGMRIVRVRLLMDGFTDYFSANSMYAAWRAGHRAGAALCRNAAMTHAKWVRIVNDMGFPAGLARTMVVDVLTGKLPPGSRFDSHHHKSRKSIGIAFAWIIPRWRYSVSRFTESADKREAAEARFPRLPSRSGRQSAINDLRYIYEQVSATGPYTRQIGNYTRYRRRDRSR